MSRKKAKGVPLREARQQFPVRDFDQSEEVADGADNWWDEYRDPKAPSPPARKTKNGTA
jgi:hypothetical protein